MGELRPGSRKRQEKPTKKAKTGSARASTEQIFLDGQEEIRSFCRFFPQPLKPGADSAVHRPIRLLDQPDSQSLKVPTNMRLLNLPPDAPELNPAEHVWDELREKHFHNRVFDSIGAFEDHLEAALRAFGNDPERLRSIVSWPWIKNVLMVQKWNYNYLELRRYQVCGRWQLQL